MYAPPNMNIDRSYKKFNTSLRREEVICKMFNILEELKHRKLENKTFEYNLKYEILMGIFLECLVYLEFMEDVGELPCDAYNLEIPKYLVYIEPLYINESRAVDNSDITIKNEKRIEPSGISSPMRDNINIIPTPLPVDRDIGKRETAKKRCCTIS